MTILVCGATGQIGTSLRALLDERGLAWIGLSRRAPISAQWRQAELEQPGSLGPALAGIDTVFLVSADHPRQHALELGMIEACRARAVTRIVKLSAHSAGLARPVSFGVMHAQTERALRDSGVAWTVLRPTFFMQSLLLMAGSIQSGKLIAATGAGEVAFVDVRDIAACALAVLEAPGEHDGEVYTLTGPRALSFAAVAEQLARVTGHPVRHVSPPRLLARLVMPLVSGLPRWQCNAIVELMAALAEGAQAQTTDDVRRLTGAEPRTLEAFLAEHRDSFVR